MASAEEPVQTADSEAPPQKLSDLLESGRKLYEELEKSHEPTNSDAVQIKIKRGIKQLEEATLRVSQLELFSRNEELDEISTADMKFLLLPALLAALVMKQVGVAQRLEHVRTARRHYVHFLTSCKDYNISAFHLPPDTHHAEEPSGVETNTPSPAHQHQADLITMATQRQAKIERYKQQKAVEQKLAELRVQVDSGGAQDDEVMREFYVLQLRRWIAFALEEVDSIDQEVQILKRMPALNQAAAEKPRRAPMKPFILTKDALQAKVFGAGYPSLPSMTVDDWYEQHRMRGCLPEQGIPQSTVDVNTEEREEEEKERKEEEDDKEALQKARDWDNWKDTHRRGYGNRHNMG